MPAGLVARSGQVTRSAGRAPQAVVSTATPAPAGTTLSSSPGTTFPSSQTVNAFPSFQVDMGAEEYAAGPAANYVDSPLITMPTANGLIAYSANSTTYAFPGAGLSAISFPKGNASTAQAVLSPGPASEFDECGAWLDSAYEVSATHWIGWYHAEHACNYSVGTTHKSIAFAESFDGGRTWQKTGYPGNQVITPPAQDAGDPLLDRAGDARVVRQGAYFFMLYVGGDYKTYLARSPLSSEGKPGTWQKYYQGAWSQPGIGGQQSAVNANPGGLSFNTYLGSDLNVFASARWGFYFRVSAGTDITTWKDLDGDGTKSVYPLVSYPSDPAQDVWTGRTASSGLVYGYPQVIGLDGSSSTSGQVFYLYYMKLFAGDGFSQRYLMRRKVVLTLVASSTTAAPASRVALTSYRDPAGKLVASSELPRPSQGYSAQGVIGDLLTYPASGFHPVYECWDTVDLDYIPTNADLSSVQWQYCENTPTIHLVRNLGWASDAQTPQASVPIYRCWKPKLVTHFVSTDPGCGGDKMEWLLGYVFPAPVSS